MSFQKYRLRDVATDFGTNAKEISEIVGKYFEKPKNNTQVLGDDELNVVFDRMTHAQGAAQGCRPRRPEPSG